ncbi:MAG: hypothetical protein VKK63_10720 [Synechococcus sp.]|nr:hypothetical protein [Synechococcus sp.]
MKESNTASDRATGQAHINASNAAELYARISSDQALTQSLFRQALQDPTGSLERIVELGQAFDLPVTVQEVRNYIATLDDIDSKQWLVKARGGL